MPITISGSTGIAGVDGTAATPALQGTDTNTGIYYGANEVYISTDGSVRATVSNSGLTLATPLVFPAGTVGAPSITTTGDTNTGIYFPAADTIGFVEGGVEAMRLDASGNLGLGVTPSAWGGTFKALQVGAQASISYNAGFAVFGNNNYYDGSSYKYIATTAASDYYQHNGQHVWRNAPSGTAGNAISFTQAMTLDASGNLNIGGTGGTQKLSLQSGSSGAAVFLRGADPATGTAAAFIQTPVSSGFSSIAVYNFWYQTAGMSNPANESLGFVTNSTERARIDSSGNLLVGTTSGSGKVRIESNIYATATALVLKNTVSDTGGSYIEYRNSSDALAGYVYQSGSTAVTYTNTSDVSLKENIVDASSALASILSLPIRQFDWKSDKSHTEYGLIAQEADEYAPEIVAKAELWGVDYGRITPRLIKAFQELAAKVTALEAANG